jgi:hypothetical protein
MITLSDVCFWFLVVVANRQPATTKCVIFDRSFQVLSKAKLILLRKASKEAL